jgi:N-acetylneuraminic acid mutarotase
MKKIILLLSLGTLSFNAMADKFVWNVKAGYPGVGRHRASGIGIGNKVYYGLGHVSSGSANVGFQDWWEYDPATNAWTQKVNFPHQSHGAVGFTIGNKGYMGSGDSESIGATSLFYEFDPIANTWTQKANCPLSDDGHVSFAINGLGYIGLGNSNALHAYNPISNTWQLVSTAMPGSWWGVAFVVNNKAYYIPSFSNTMYMFDPTTNAVTTKAPFISIGRIAAAGFSVRGNGYVGLGTTGFDGPYDLKDFYQYDPITNVWDTIPKSFPGARRHFVPCVTIGDNVYFGTGTNGTNLADFWCYQWQVSVGIEAFTKTGNLNVFPNPASEFITLAINKEFASSDLSVNIIAVDSKLIHSQIIDAAQTTLTISHYPKGIYFVNILNDKKETLSTKKIIIN